jgi:hypothetical protein
MGMVFLGVSCLPVVLPGAERTPCLRVEYQTTGDLPGESAEGGRRSGFQWITVAEDGLRLVLEEFRAGPAQPEPRKEGTALVPDRKFILRMDREPPVIYEVFDGGRKYREHAGDMNSLQVDRRIAEKAMVKAARELPARERDEFLRRSYLRLDSPERVVDVVLEPGKELLGKKCEHVVISENGRTIIDAQVTRDVPGARSYYQLYRRLGAFSQEVVDKLGEIAGVPLEAKITVVTALPAYEFQVQVTRITPLEVEAGGFDVPPGAVLVKDESSGVCHQCGKTIPDPANPPAKGVVEGRRVSLCSDRCFEEFSRQRGIKSRSAPPGGGAPPKTAPAPEGKSAR